MQVVKLAGEIGGGSALFYSVDCMVRLNVKKESGIQSHVNTFEPLLLFFFLGNHLYVAALQG